jgi:hypothetical protein
MSEVAKMRSRRVSGLRLCALVGAGLVVISIAMANLKPFDYGDMRALPWSGAAFILLVIGGLLLLIAVLDWLMADIRRRSSLTQR